MYFSSKISLKSLKIETSYLINRMTSCIVGLRMGRFLFVLLCICSFVLTIFLPEISPHLCNIESSYVVQVDNDKLYGRIEIRPASVCSLIILSIHSVLYIFVKNFSATF